MKNAALMFVIAGVMAIVTPRDMREAAALSMRAGVALINLAVALYPNWYDANRDDDDDRDNKASHVGPGTSKSRKNAETDA
jgi:hypothetical protein